MTLQEQWRDLARQARELRLEKSCSTDWYTLTKVAQALEGCAADLDKQQAKSSANYQSQAAQAGQAVHQGFADWYDSIRITQVNPGRKVTMRTVIAPCQFCDASGKWANGEQCRQCRGTGQKVTVQ